MIQSLQKPYFDHHINHVFTIYIYNFSFCKYNFSNGRCNLLNYIFIYNFLKHASTYFRIQLFLDIGQNVTQIKMNPKYINFVYVSYFGYSELCSEDFIQNTVKVTEIKYIYIYIFIYLQSQSFYILRNKTSQKLLVANNLKAV